jgi:hypothetical protein
MRRFTAALSLVAAISCGVQHAALPSWRPPGVSPLENSTAVLLRALEGTDPITAAEAAAAVHDYRLLGCLGYALTVPGLTGDQWTRYARVHGVAVIAGTGELWTNDADSAFNVTAIKYAIAYNEAVLRRLPALWR